MSEQINDNNNVNTQNNTTRSGGRSSSGRAGGPPGHGHGGMMVQRAKNFKAAIAKLLEYLSPYKIPITIVLVFATASSAFSILGPKILSKATGAIIEGVIGKITGIKEGIDFTYVGMIMLYLLGLYVVSSFLGYMQGWIMSAFP